MTQHLHPEFVPGCYRCDLSRDEAAGVPELTWDVLAVFADWDARDARQATEAATPPDTLT